MRGNDSYYSNDRTLTHAVKYIDVQKYEENVLVWFAISPKGMSQIYFRASGLAVNQDVYLDDCLIKRLKPFIAQHYIGQKYVFWSDFASSHYAKSVTNW